MRIMIAQRAWWGMEVEKFKMDKIYKMTLGRKR